MEAQKRAMAEEIEADRGAPGHPEPSAAGSGRPVVKKLQRELAGLEEQRKKLRKGVPAHPPEAL